MIVKIVRNLSRGRSPCQRVNHVKSGVIYFSAFIYSCIRYYSYVEPGPNTSEGGISVSAMDKPLNWLQDFAQLDDLRLLISPALHRESSKWTTGSTNANPLDSLPHPESPLFTVHCTEFSDLNGSEVPSGMFGTLPSKKLAAKEL